MTDREPLAWNVPATEVERFREWVHQKHGCHGPYVRFEIEESMRAFLDRDAGADAEQLVDSFIEAAGRSREQSREKIECEVTRTVGHRVPEDLKAAFKKQVDAGNLERDPRLERVTYGRALAVALREHRDGGRWKRVTEKVERIAEPARGALSEVYGDGGEKLTGRARKRQKIIRELDERFTHSDFVDVIGRVAGETVVDDYADAVLEELEYSEHPGTRDQPDRTLYIPTAEAEALARERAEDRRREAERAADAELEDTGTAADVDGEHGSEDSAQERDDDPADDGSGPTPSTAQRALMADLGADPDDPEHVRAFLTDDGPDLDDVLELEDTDTDTGGDADGAGDDRADQEGSDDREQLAVATDGGVAIDAPPAADPCSSTAATTSSAPAPATPDVDDPGDGIDAVDRPTPLPRLDCPCCGATVPSHVDVEIRGGRAVKECPRCRGSVDLEAAASGSRDAPPEPRG